MFGSRHPSRPGRPPSGSRRLALGPRGRTRMPRSRDCSLGRGADAYLLAPAERAQIQSALVVTQRGSSPLRFRLVIGREEKPTRGDWTGDLPVAVRLRGGEKVTRWLCFRSVVTQESVRAAYHKKEKRKRDLSFQTANQRGA